MMTRVAGLKTQDKPVEGETLGVRIMVPLKPSRLVMVMVELAFVFRKTVMLVGLALAVKSCTTKFAVTVWPTPALDPVIVTA